MPNELTRVMLKSVIVCPSQSHPATGCPSTSKNAPADSGTSTYPESNMGVAVHGVAPTVADASVTATPFTPL